MLKYLSPFGSWRNCFFKNVLYIKRIHHQYGGLVSSCLNVPSTSPSVYNPRTDLLHVLWSPGRASVLCMLGNLVTSSTVLYSWIRAWLYSFPKPCRIVWTSPQHSPAALDFKCLWPSFLSSPESPYTSSRLSGMCVKPPLSGECDSLSPSYFVYYAVIQAALLLSSSTLSAHYQHFSFPLSFYVVSWSKKTLPRKRKYILNSTPYRQARI